MVIHRDVWCSVRWRGQGGESRLCIEQHDFPARALPLAGSYLAIQCLGVSTCETGRYVCSYFVEVPGRFNEVLLREHSELPGACSMLRECQRCVSAHFSLFISYLSRSPVFLRTTHADVSASASLLLLQSAGCIADILLLIPQRWTPTWQCSKEFPLQTSGRTSPRSGAAGS